MIQLLEKAIFIAIADSYYILPLIGSIQLFSIGILYKKQNLSYFGSLLFLVFCLIFPFAKLVPNLGSDAFSELQQIDFDEAYFYIKTLNFFAGWSNKQFFLWFVIIIFYFISIFVLFFLSKKFKFLNFLKINLFIIFVIIIFPTSTNLYKVVNLLNSSILAKKNETKNLNYQLDSLDVYPARHEDLSIFLYIGEATSRLHWSLYKYFRNTNQNLENYAKNNPLIIFDNIHSTHSHTSPSLLDALSIKMEPYDKSINLISDYKRYPLTDILEKASIDTILYSNQAKSGSWNQSSSLIFKNANKKIYSSKYNLGNSDHVNKDKPYDHKFLEKYLNDIKEMPKSNNFYVFHSYAGHGGYKENIPKKYHGYIDQYYFKQSNQSIFGNKFKMNQKEFLENYDSAMKYVSDNILLTLKEISKFKKPIIFIYTSDHGESPLTGRAHDSSRYIWEMSAVPFLIFFNEEAKLRYPELYKKINERKLKRNKELLNNLPSLIFELYGIKIFNQNLNLHKVSQCIFGEDNCVDEYHLIRNQLNSKKSVVSFEFPNKNNEVMDNTDRATTFFLMKKFLDKKSIGTEICSHRTNTIARFIRFNATINCLELDVIIKDDYLDITHSINESTSLKLIDLIKVQKDKKNILWLDVKNVNDVNQCNKLLNSLKKIYNQNNEVNLFIEFPSFVLNKLESLNNCILKIKSMNFLTSYYIPSNLKSKCIKEQELKISKNNKCKYSNDLLEKIFKSNLFTDLSFDYENYEILKKNKYVEMFNLNTWHIPDEKIEYLQDSEFRLVIPFNDGTNYN